MAKCNTVDEILRLHRIGATNSEISKWMNVDEAYVALVLKEAGYERK
jgi:hypothetical protein